MLLLLVAAAAFSVVPTASAQNLACVNSTNGMCMCSGSFVNCAFQTLTLTSSISFPTTTTTLLLNDNSFYSISSSFFANTKSVQILHLERNGLEILQSGVFTPMLQLQELYLQDNIISLLQNGLFANLTQLTTLNMAYNRITSIPSGMFDSLTSIRILLLSRNAIKALPNSAIFNNNVNLNTLSLDNNLLTILPSFVFNKTVNLVQLTMMLNQMYIIPNGTFNNLQYLSTLRMEGNPSQCSINPQTAKPSCNCYAGYVGTSYCIPINCGSSILGLDPNAYATCTNNTSYLGNNCTASCSSGYVGSNSSFYCNTVGNWTGSITCLPINCTSSIALPSNAQGTCSGNTVYLGDNCTLSCNVGYVPVGSNNYYCNQQGQWTGAFSCRPLDCGPTIANLDVHAINVTCNPTTYLSTCMATCSYGFLGGPAPFTCAANGQWSGTLACLGVECGRTVSGLPANTTARCRGNTAYLGSPCTASCDRGFEPVPGFNATATYSCAQNAKWTLASSPLMCQPVDCGELNSTIIDMNAQSDCIDTHYGSAPCPVTCNAGYIGSTTYTCPYIGVWLGNLTCIPVDCGPKIQNLPSNAVANCTGNTKYLGNSCQAQCAQNWTGNPLNYSCSQNAVWTSPQLQISCLRYDCGHVLVTPYVTKNCTGLTRYGGTPCSVSCPTGMIGSAVNYTCGINGTWIGNLNCTVPPAAPASSLATASIGAGVGVGVLAVVVVIIVIIVLRRKPASDRKRSTGSRNSGMPIMSKDDEDPSMILNPLHQSFRRRTNTDVMRDALESGTDFEEEPVMIVNPRLSMSQRPLPPRPVTVDHSGMPV